MKRDSRGVQFSVWFYTKLLVLYPLVFQQHYGREMALTFRDVCRREYGRFGVSGLTGLWFEIFIDLASSALQEHIREVRMLSERQSFIRITGILGAAGGVFSIIIGIVIARGDLGEDVTPLQAGLFVLTFLLIAVGTTGYFAAGRQERDINAALGILLFGALTGAVGPVLMAADIGAGWIMWFIGLLLQGLGFLLLGVTARQNPGFIGPSWLPLVLGSSLTVLLIVGLAAADSSVQGTIIGLTLGLLGGGWLLLGLLLLSGNIRTDVQPPNVA